MVSEHASDVFRNAGFFIEAYLAAGKGQEAGDRRMVFDLGGWFLFLPFLELGSYFADADIVAVGPSGSEPAIDLLPDPGGEAAELDGGGIFAENIGVESVVADPAAEGLEFQDELRELFITAGERTEGPPVCLGIVGGGRRWAP